MIRKWFHYHCWHYDDYIKKSGQEKQKACKYLCNEEVKDEYGYIDLSHACNCTGKKVGSVKKAQKNCIRGIRFITSKPIRRTK